MVCSTSIIGDAPPFLIRPIALSLRHFSDAMLREVDVCQGLILHLALGLISALPISYVHGRAAQSCCLFNFSHSPSRHACQCCKP